jgi:alkylation response protein AidB-like acyl-CoA dehydrogenase
MSDRSLVTPHITHRWVLPDDTREAILQWFGARAAAVDCGQIPAHEGVRHAARRGWLGYGISSELGGWGEDLEPMVEVIALAARGCFASAFSLWSQRMLAAYLAASPNAFLRSDVLPSVLQGERFGSTGLANAMRHAVGLEPLMLRASRWPGGFTLTGRLPWASNLVPGRFIVAVAAVGDDGQEILFAVPADTPGLVREADFSLVALEATATTGLEFNDASVPDRWMLSDDFGAFMATVRPTFLLLQCGFCWGLAEAALLAAAGARDGLAQQVLAAELQATQDALEELAGRIRSHSRIRDWTTDALTALLQVRLDIATLAVQSVWLELTAMGGAAYRKTGPTARRIREVAFLPIQAPTVIQLRWELSRRMGGSS